jgi:tetratricopeptide (TPR) repeat protein
MCPDRLRRLSQAVPLLLLPLLLLCASARAQAPASTQAPSQPSVQTNDDLERAKASFKAGAAAYAAGEYPAAIQALDTAYELTPLPAIAFSLGQAERRQYFVAHERQHLERAVALFRRYVADVPSKTSTRKISPSTSGRCAAATAFASARG